MDLQDITKQAITVKKTTNHELDDGRKVTVYHVGKSRYVTSEKYTELVKGTKFKQIKRISFPARMELPKMYFDYGALSSDNQAVLNNLNAKAVFERRITQTWRKAIKGLKSQLANSLSSEERANIVNLLDTDYSSVRDFLLNVKDDSSPSDMIW